MKPMTLWARSVLSDAAVIALLYWWQVNGSEGAGNALGFMVWVVIVLRIFVGLLGDKTMFAKIPRPSAFVAYHFVTELITIASIAWLGHFWMAGMYVFAVLLYEGARTKEPKAKGEAA